MPTDVKIYKVRDFIRFNESGEIDFDRSMRMIHEFATTATLHAGCNILADLRETTVIGETNIGMVMQLALEVARYWSAYKGKIANVVPHDEKRLLVAKQFEAAMQLQGFNLKVFTSFEGAIDWLSEVTDVSDSGEAKRLS